SLIGDSDDDVLVLPIRQAAKRNLEAQIRGHAFGPSEHVTGAIVQLRRVDSGTGLISRDLSPQELGGRLGAVDGHPDRTHGLGGGGRWGSGDRSRRLLPRGERYADGVGR